MRLCLKTKQWCTTFVNDVYAYYLTAVKNGQMSGSQALQQQGARDSICAIAAAKGA